MFLKFGVKTPEFVQLVWWVKGRGLLGVKRGKEKGLIRGHKGSNVGFYQLQILCLFISMYICTVNLLSLLNIHRLCCWKIKVAQSQMTSVMHYPIILSFPLFSVLMFTVWDRQMNEWSRKRRHLPCRDPVCLTRRRRRLFQVQTFSTPLHF